MGQMQRVGSRRDALLLACRQLPQSRASRKPQPGKAARLAKKINRLACFSVPKIGRHGICTIVHLQNFTAQRGLQAAFTLGCCTIDAVKIGFFGHWRTQSLSIHRRPPGDEQVVL